MSNFIVHRNNDTDTLRAENFDWKLREKPPDSPHLLNKSQFLHHGLLEMLGLQEKNPRKWKENLLGAAPEGSHSSLKQKDKHEEGIKLLTGTQSNTTRFFHRLFNDKKPTMYFSFISAQSLHPKLPGAKNKEQGTPFLLKITLLNHGVYDCCKAHLTKPLFFIVVFSFFT